MIKKLILIGSNCVHTYNYLKLIENYFDDIVILTNRAKNNFFDNLKYRIYYLNFSLKKPLMVFFTIFKIRKIIKYFKPHIIHLHQAGTYAFIPLLIIKKFNIPVVLTTWGSDILISPNKFIYKKLVQFVLKNSNIITSDSFYVAYKIKELIKNLDKEIVIANFGVKTSLCSSNTKKENIIYSNRLHKDIYNIDIIIKMFYEFNKRRNEKYKLIVAGDGDLKNYYIDLVKKLNLEDYVQFVGWLDSEKNFYYYNISKIYISLPKSDATSISLLESMACGCIPIVSNIPANLEWIIDGLNGIVSYNFSSLDFDKALDLDCSKAYEINKFLINSKAKIEINKEKFISIYEKLIK